MQPQTSTLLSAVAVFFSIPGILAAVGAPVNTTSGLIVGHADPLYPSVSEYLGIPFAQPPVGSLRFASPQKYSETKRIVADKQPMSCPQTPTVRNTSEPQPQQNIDASKSVFTTNTSEDCLYLNVWTKYPSSCTHEKKKPVLVWFYGGGFHAGGASDNGEQGGIFADEQDVVMVNFNYRLGILGFSGAPDLTPNVGLLDQRLALEWVRDNIEAFGGDASKITIIGHSAGAASVDYYTYAWLDDPIIAGSIPMSGTTTSFGRRTLSTGEAAWDGTSELLGCGEPNTTSSSTILECMRKMSTEDLYKASLKAGTAVAMKLSQEDQIYVGVTGIFSPTIDNKTIFANYTILGNQGKFIKVPIMTGNNIDEACLFSQKGQFPAQDDPDITELIFTCPVNYAATFRASAGIPAWKYRWFGGYPNQNFQVCPGKPWHGSEVTVMFGATKIASEENATKKEDVDGLYMRQSVAAFAHDPSSGLKTTMHWPEFNSNETQVVELATNQTVMTVGSAVEIDKSCFTLFRNGGPNY